MNGVDINRIFYSKYNEITGGMISPIRLNDQFLQSTIEYFTPLFREYGRTGAINDELRCLITEVTVNNPSSYQVNFTSLPNYQAVSSITTNWTLNGQTYVKTATLMPINSMENSYSNGTVYAPRYQMLADKVKLFPSQGTLNSVKINYLRTVIPINVESTTELPYSEQSIRGIIDQMISIYAASLGDMESYNVAERSQVENTNIPRK